MKRLVWLFSALLMLSAPVLAQSQPGGNSLPLRGNQGAGPSAGHSSPPPNAASSPPNAANSAPPNAANSPPNAANSAPPNAATGSSAGVMPGLDSPTQTMPDTSVQFNYARTPENPATPIEDSLRAPLHASSRSPTAQTPLQGQASSSSQAVKATARLLPKEPLARCRDQSLKFVELTVKNDSPQVALVHGDIAQANVNGVMKTATAARYVGSVSQPKLGLTGRIATGVAEVGTVGLAGPIVYENLTPDQHHKRYLGTAIGVDGSRHEIEGSRFGLRVLMPGEETVGWVAFECDGKDPSNVVIPVNYSKSSLPSGTLVVSVAKGVENHTTAPPNSAH